MDVFILAKQYGRKVTRIAVGERPSIAVHLRDKCRDERRYGLQIAQVAIDFRGDRRRVKVRTAAALQKACQMGEPHSRRNAFTRNISQHGENPGSILREGRKVSGEITRREHLPGKLKVAAAQHPRAAELTLNLHRVKKLRMEINTLSQKQIQLIT